MDSSTLPVSFMDDCVCAAVAPVVCVVVFGHSTPARLAKDQQTTSKLSDKNLYATDHGSNVLLMSEFYCERGSFPVVSHQVISSINPTLTTADIDKPPLCWMVFITSYEVAGATSLTSQWPTVASPSAQPRSSLGSRFVLCGRRLLVTGTPNQGAHSPWIFELDVAWRPGFWDLVVLKLMK